MFRPSFPLVLLLLAARCAFVHGQSDQDARPRRIQKLPSASQATNRPPASPEARAEARRLYKIGVKYGHARLFKQAADVFEDVVELDPHYTDAYLSLGHAYYDLAQWQQAVDILEYGLTLKPKDKESQGRLAHARTMLKQETPARPENWGNGHSEGYGTNASPSLSSHASPTRESSRLAASGNALTKVYRVGPGDILDVRLSEDGSAAPTLFTLTSEGLLEHPRLSAPLRGAGLTVEELTARIEADLKARSATRNPIVSVAIQEYVSHTILVSGLVKEPGAKIIKREAIPLYVVIADAQALPEAGRVTVLRNESNESFVIDLFDESQMALLIRTGDVINVQANPVEFFYLAGEVKSPGEKTFRRGLTLTQAIIAAGGLNKDAKQARLGRDNGKGFLTVYRYKLKDIDSGKMPDPVLQPGDRITIE